MRYLFIGLFLVFHSLAWADEPRYVDKAKTILFHSSSECQAILGHLLSPEKKIADALEALFSTNEDAARKRECLDFAVQDWNEHFTGNADDMFYKNPYSLKMQKVDELMRKMQCHNPYSESTQMFSQYQEQMASFCPNWFTKEEYKKLTAEYQEKMQVIYREQNINWSRSNASLRILKEIIKEQESKFTPLDAQGWTSGFEVIPKLKNQEEKLLQVAICFVPPTYGTYQVENHKKNYSELCKKWISNEEKLEIEKEIKKEWAQLGEIDAFWKNKKLEFNNNYSKRRLLALFSGYSKRNKNADLKKFCDQQEKDSERDAKFEGLVHGYSLQKFYSSSQWKIALAGSLTEAEVEAITSFTGNYYTVINKAIWSQNTSASTIYYKELLDTALEKAPGPYDGVVMRGSDLPANVLEQHQVGNIVTYDAFTSTSKRKNWDWPGKHRFVIYPAKKGRDVSSISSHPEEEEVLFQAGTRFKVLSRKEKAQGVIEFVLAEVNENGEVIAKLPN